MSKPLMTTIPVRDAVGTVLCQDITRIEPSKSKGPVFRKGHVVRAEDIDILLSVSKEHLYVYCRDAFDFLFPIPHVYPHRWRQFLYRATS